MRANGMPGWMALVLALSFAACGSSGGDADAGPGPVDGRTEDGVQDTMVPDIVPTDIVPTDIVPTELPNDGVAPEDVPADVPADVPEPDGTEPDVVPDVPDDVVPPEDFGFDIRVPENHTLECEGPMGSQELNQPDTDWICTLEYEGVSGVVYVQATPSSCYVIMTPLAEFETQVWVSIDGQVAEAEDGWYDWGGNHNNDWFAFTWEGVHYKYYHSSFGFGWRKCQPMDCINVLDDGGDIIEEGCTKERTLPIVCVPIQADGSYEELVDTFEPCPGDPNYE